MTFIYRVPYTITEVILFCFVFSVVQIKGAKRYGVFSLSTIVVALILLAKRFGKIAKEKPKVDRWRLCVFGALGNGILFERAYWTIGASVFRFGGGRSADIEAFGVY